MLEFFRILEGLKITLLVSLSSAFISIIIGYIFGFILNSNKKILILLSRIYLEFFRIVPQLVLLYVFYFAIFGKIDPEICAIIVFSLWGTAEVGDLVRGLVNAISIGQVEAAHSIGLSHFQVKLKIIIPQTIRPFVPMCVNLLTRMIKTTSIISLISAVDILKVCQQIADFNTRFFHDKYATLTLYLLCFVLYFLLCWPLSLVEKSLAKRSAKLTI